MTLLLTKVKSKSYISHHTTNQQQKALNFSFQWTLIWFRITDFLDFVHSPDNSITRKKVSEIGSVSVFRWAEGDTCILGSVRKWLRLALSPNPRQRLSLSIGHNWVGTTWRRRQNPIYETFCFKQKDWTKDKVQNFVTLQDNRREHLKKQPSIYRISV
jgi:hypothetical protein